MRTQPTGLSSLFTEALAHTLTGWRLRAASWTGSRFLWLILRFTRRVLLTETLSPLVGLLLGLCDQAAYPGRECALAGSTKFAQYVCNCGLAYSPGICTASSA